MPKPSKWKASHVTCQAALDNVKADLGAEVERLTAENTGLRVEVAAPLDEYTRIQQALDAAEQEIARLREALQDIKLRYDEEGSFAAREMWRVAYETLDRE